VPQEPRAKSWPTQPYPVGGDAFVPQCADPVGGLRFHHRLSVRAVLDRPVIGGPGVAAATTGRRCPTTRT